jgi:hypothetical protein
MKNLRLVILVISLVGPAGAQPTQKVKSAATPITTEHKAQLLTQTKQRIGQLDSVLKSVTWEDPKAAKAGKLDVSAAQKKADAEFNSWLLGVRTKLQSLRRDMQAASALSGEEAVQKMAQLNTQFLALQEATQMESRKFQTLSNASKARHDIALNAIRNMR